MDILKHIRSTVSGDKHRFTFGDINIDFTYITDRIIGKLLRPCENFLRCFGKVLVGFANFRRMGGKVPAMTRVLRTILFPFYVFVFCWPVRSFFVEWALQIPVGVGGKVLGMTWRLRPSYGLFLCVSRFVTPSVFRPNKRLSIFVFVFWPVRGFRYLTTSRKSPFISVLRL